MQLSDGERLITALLCDLAAGGRDFDHAMILQALRGQDWAIELAYPGLFPDCRPPEHVEEVIAILATWTELERAAAGLNAAAFHTATGLHLDGFRFTGFDATNEPVQYGAAVMLVERLGRFRNFQGRQLDSHAQTLPGYRAMLTAFERVTGATPGRPLALAEVVEIARAATTAR